MKQARRRAREIALQALYAWQLGGGGTSEIVDQARALDGWARCDAALAETLIRSVVDGAAGLQARIAPCLQARTFVELSPIERAILYIGALELVEHADTPFRVVLNEAIELGKSFGGTDGHRFVNGVLECLARNERPQEFAQAREAV